MGINRMELIAVFLQFDRLLDDAIEQGLSKAVIGQIGKLRGRAFERINFEKYYEKKKKE